MTQDDFEQKRRVIADELPPEQLTIFTSWPKTIERPPDFILGVIS